MSKYYLESRQVKDLLTNLFPRFDKPDCSLNEVIHFHLPSLGCGILWISCGDHPVVGHFPGAGSFARPFGKEGHGLDK